MHLAGVEGWTRQQATPVCANIMLFDVGLQPSPSGFDKLSLATGSFVR